jgi:glycosyltransferase involved in cell wall biosynthesis
MRILTTLSYWRPYISGLTICAQRLIEGLSKRDFEFAVLTSRHDKSLPRTEKKGKILILRETVMFTVGKVPVMPRYLFSLIREMRRADLVWIHLPQAEGLPAAILAKIFRKRVIVTVHCLPLLPSGWQRLFFQKFFDYVNNLIIKLADRVVYYTKDYAENTPELWHFPPKSHYILPPIPSVNNVTIKQFNNSVFTLGFAGRVAEDKGLEYLIKAIQLMKLEGKNVRLLVAGSREAVGEGRYSKKINSLIDESGIYVKFLGEIDPDKMSAFYRRIDVLALPSVNRTESFGIVQVEAMKHGVPVVTSDLPGVRIPVRMTHNGKVVTPGDPNSLAQAIISLSKRITNNGEKNELAAETFFYFDTIKSYREIFAETWK